MLSGWLQLLVTRPQLLADHASAWAGLLAAEGGAALGEWQARLQLQLAAALCALLGLGFAGVALMLWAVVADAPWAQPRTAWVLAGLPLLMLCTSGALWFAAQRRASGQPQARLARLAQQWQADAALLQPQTPATP